MTCKTCGREFHPLGARQERCRACQWNYKPDTSKYQKKYREADRIIKNYERAERKKIDDQYKKLYALTQVQKRITLPWSLEGMARATLRG